MLACNNDILISLEKSQFKIIYLRSKKFENITVKPLIDNDQLGYFIAGAVSHCGEYICVSDDFKRLFLFKKTDDTWVIKGQGILDRRCSNIKFSLDMNFILIADKSGYLLKFPLEFEEFALNNEENRLKYIVLGHISVLVDFDLHPSQKLIATADRDEKIRLSHYPKCYEIYTFLLGHEKYVTQIAFSDNGSVLYSAAADGYVIFWDLCQKKEVHRHKYFVGIDRMNLLVVTRMFIDNGKIFLFFKNESSLEIITFHNTNEGGFVTNSQVVGLQWSVLDVACSKTEGHCHFHGMSKNETQEYQFKTLSFEHASGTVDSINEDFKEKINLANSSIFERNKFLDTLSKVAVDKTGLDIYFERKEKRLRKGDREINDDQEEEEDD